MGKCCSCVLWEYNKFTEEVYGMGVGVCGADGSQRFCEHKCPFCVEERGADDGKVD